VQNLDVTAIHVGHIYSAPIHPEHLPVDHNKTRYIQKDGWVFKMKDGTLFL